MCISWTINGLISLMHGVTMKILVIFSTECSARCRVRLDDGEQRDIYCSCLERNPRFLAVGPSVEYYGV